MSHRLGISILDDSLQVSGGALCFLKGACTSVRLGLSVLVNVTFFAAVPSKRKDRGAIGELFFCETAKTEDLD